MLLAGLPQPSALKVDVTGPTTGPELRAANRGELLPLLPGSADAETRIRSLSRHCGRNEATLLLRFVGH
jgi:hypothetical protein